MKGNAKSAQAAGSNRPEPTSLADRYVTDTIASEILGVPVRTLRRWRIERRGPIFRKFGGVLVRYAVSDLLDFANREIVPNRRKKAEYNGLGME
jgi:hypothetical protein